MAAGPDERDGYKREKTVSGHFLRRTARAVEQAREEEERRLRQSNPSRAFSYRYYVESTVRGPFGWRVVRYIEAN